MFDNLVAGLCRDLGLNAPTEGTDGAFYLQADELEIGILEEPENGTLLITCAVGSLGAETQPGAYMELAEANYYWGATNGATLGFNSATGEVVLHRQWALQALDAAQLLELVEAFVAAAEFWRERLAGRGAAPSAGGARLDAMTLRA